jgi:hypothetical protein
MISLGQQRLIFAVAGRSGLRTDQVFDLVECCSDLRVRDVGELTTKESGKLVGVLLKMERNCPARPTEVQAVRRGGRIAR